MTKNVLVGFFHVDGVGEDTVEVPLTGDGKVDHAALHAAIQKKHKKVLPKSITRVGSAIEQRSETPKEIAYPVGALIHSLFTANGTDESSLSIGTVIFGDESCEVVLRYLRSRATVGVTLKERMSGVPIRFTDSIDAGRPVRDLTAAVAGILGNKARELKLTFREVRPVM